MGESGTELRYECGRNRAERGTIMAITFYYGSGSPYAWKVWLALEHKGLPYEAERLTFDPDQTKTPEFLTINPRGRVPAIVDDGFALYESNAIVEYLEDRYPAKPILAEDPKARALARRLAGEADSYLGIVGGALIDLTLYTKEAERDPQRIAEAKEKVRAELVHWEAALTEDYLAGELGLADYAAYPWVRMLVRAEERGAGLGFERAELPPKLAAWLQRIEALPYYEKTVPPHWRG
jgi:glutathione S-transferase